MGCDISQPIYGLRYGHIATDISVATYRNPSTHSPQHSAVPVNLCQRPLATCASVPFNFCLRLPQLPPATPLLRGNAGRWVATYHCKRAGACLPSLLTLGHTRSPPPLQPHWRPPLVTQRSTSVTATARGGAEEQPLILTWPPRRGDKCPLLIVGRGGIEGWASRG
jgi:hypothetical protein